MRLLGFALLLAAFPIFLYLLRGKTRKPVFMLFGALCLLTTTINSDAALVSWTLWLGHSTALSVSALDILAIAILIKIPPRRTPPLLFCYVILVLTAIPSLFTGALFTPALFFFFELLRAGLVFCATFSICLSGGLRDLLNGLALAVIANSAVAVSQWLTADGQATGLFVHQNMGGLVTNICVPFFVMSLFVNSRSWLQTGALIAAVATAVAGSSRATLVLQGLSILAASVLFTFAHPRARSYAIAGSLLATILIGIPLAASRLESRFHGGAISLRLDDEREHFETAARMIIADHPWGIGANQYVQVANVGGYLDRARVAPRSQSRSTNVHNTYLLVRAELGAIGYVGFLIWLLAPILIAFGCGLRKTRRQRGLMLACGVSLSIAAIHSRFEWIAITMTVQYMLAVTLGILAASVSLSGRRSRRPPPDRISKEASLGLRPSGGSRSQKGATFDHLGIG